MANTLHQLKRATEIVARYRARGNVFPRELRNCGRGDPESQQEYRDACKVKTWKYSLLGKNIYNCSDEIRDYLDENMPGWSDRVYSHQGQSSSVQMQKAVQIVQRYKERGNVLPRRLKDPAKAQETKDAINISTWKSSLKGYNRVTCSKELCAYLDENMPGWRLDHHKSKPRSKEGKEREKRALLAGTSIAELEKREKSTELLMPIAKAIVERFHANNNRYPSLKLACRQDPSRAQEYSDAKQLHSWKSHTDPSSAPEVFAYLDEHMKDWKNSHVTPSTKNYPISKAREIFRRCTMRKGALPKLATCQPTCPALILEHKDAIKLRDWKISMIENPSDFCNNLAEYLDEKLPEWRNIDIHSPLPYDMKAQRANAAAPDTLNKRKRSDDIIDSRYTTSNGLVYNNFCSETSSESCSNSTCGSDDDEYLWPNSQKRAKLSMSPSDTPLQAMERDRSHSIVSDDINSDESAGIEALMQMSSGFYMSPTQSTVDVAAPSSTASASTPPPLFLSIPIATASTYGNGAGVAQKRPGYGLYAATSQLQA